MADKTSKGDKKNKKNDKDDDESGDDKDNKKGKKGADAEEHPDPSRAGLPGYIGVGLLGGIVVGFGPLQDAAQGNGPFEDAMLRFLACVLFCLLAASLIGRLLDSVAPLGDDRDGADPTAGDATNPVAAENGAAAGTAGAGQPAAREAAPDPSAQTAGDRNAEIGSSR